MTTTRLADRTEQGAFKLAPPREVGGTGGRVVQMVLAVPGVHDYPRGRILTPPEVLRDPAFVDALTGVPLIDDDQRAHQNLEGEVNPETIADLSIGRILRAWWDDEQQALLGEAVVDVQRGLDQLADGRVGVSIGYDAALDATPGAYDGEPYDLVQTGRDRPSNVAITYNPRHVVTHIRAADATEAQMTEIEKLLRQKLADSEGGGDLAGAILKMMMDSGARADAAEKALADKCSEFDAMKAEYDAMKSGSGDADPAEGDPPPEVEPEADMATYADAIALADRFKVQVQPGEKLAGLRRRIAVAAGVRNADSLSADALSAALDVCRATTHRLGDAWDGLATQTTQSGPHPLRNA